MQKVFIDTSVFIRFFTRDDEDKYKACETFFDQIESGYLLPYISPIVVSEIVYVLHHYYKFPKQPIIKAINAIFTLRSVRILERTDLFQAVKLWSRHKIKFNDCLIATQLKPDIILATYDQEFYKLKTLDIIIKQPDDLIT